MTQYGNILPGTDKQIISSNRTASEEGTEAVFLFTITTTTITVATITTITVATITTTTTSTTITTITTTIIAVMLCLRLGACRSRQPRRASLGALGA